MNDPHVVALHYKIDHASWVDYSGAGAFDRREDAFDVHVEDGHVHFTMKTHFATERDARCLVEDYVRSWELHAVLEVGPDMFRLRFDWADIEDRSPTLGVVSLAARPITATVTMSKAQLIVSPSTYPSPPATSLERSPDVESMLRRYLRYFEDRERLPEMANFCLTVLVASAGGRAAASQRYGIAKRILNRVGILCDSKGAEDARKAKGREHALTQEEKQFLEHVVRAMIRRVAELAHDPGASFRQLTSDEFPPK